MARAGCYVYGLIRAADVRDFGPIGLDWRGKPGPVATLVVEPVAAVVSPVAWVDNILPLRRNLEPHNRVLREIMSRTTVVPMAFGHLARSEAEVRTKLQRNLDAVVAELGRLAERVEMGLKVQWDVENIFEYLLERDQALAAERDRLGGRAVPPSWAEKIELGRAFEELLVRERELDSGRILEQLAACSIERKVLPPRTEKVVLDAAFLVDRTSVPAFEEQVYHTAGAFPAQYTFNFSGPWAPFNFVELVLDSPPGAR